MSQAYSLLTNCPIGFWKILQEFNHLPAFNTPSLPYQIHSFTNR